MISAGSLGCNAMRTASRLLACARRGVSISLIIKFRPNILCLTTETPMLYSLFRIVCNHVVLFVTNPLARNLFTWFTCSCGQILNLFVAEELPKMVKLRISLPAERHHAPVACIHPRVSTEPCRRSRAMAPAQIRWPVRGGACRCGSAP